MQPNENATDYVCEPATHFYFFSTMGYTGLVQFRELVDPRLKLAEYGLGIYLNTNAGFWVRTIYESEAEGIIFFCISIVTY